MVGQRNAPAAALTTHHAVGQPSFARHEYDDLHNTETLVLLVILRWLLLVEELHELIGWLS